MQCALVFFSEESYICVSNSPTNATSAVPHPPTRHTHPRMMNTHPRKLHPHPPTRHPQPPTRQPHPPTRQPHRKTLSLTPAHVPAHARVPTLAGSLKVTCNSSQLRRVPSHARSNTGTPPLTGESPVTHAPSQACPHSRKFLHRFVPTTARPRARAFMIKSNKSKKKIDCILEDKMTPTFNQVVVGSLCFVLLEFFYVVINQKKIFS